MFTIGAGAVTAWCICTLAVTVRPLPGLVPQGGESFITRTAREGFPPRFDEATRSVIILGTKGPWFSSENPSSTFVQLYLWATVASTLTVLAIALMALPHCIRLLLSRLLEQ